MKKKYLLVTIIGLSLTLSACSNISSTKVSMNDDDNTPSTSNQEIEADHHDEDEYSNMPAYETRGKHVLEKVNANEDFVLIDVREDFELKETGVIEGTIHLPLGSISKDSLEKAGVNQDDEVVVYCRSGNRSKKAYDIMNALGYKNVKSMRGGIVHWLEDKRPLLPWDGKDVPTQDSNEISDLNAPKISFDRVTEDLGMIGQTEIKSTEFTVFNKGTSVLEIGTITTSCACTRAEIESKTIMVGESTTLTVTFDPTVHEEPKDQFKRTVFLETNDPNTPEAEVDIWVDIDERETE